MSSPNNKSTWAENGFLAGLAVLAFVAVAPKSCLIPDPCEDFLKSAKGKEALAQARANPNPVPDNPDRIYVPMERKKGALWAPRCTAVLKP